MKQLIIIQLLIVVSFKMFAQSNIDKVVSKVEKNNTTLQAVQKRADAEKLNNKTGIYPDNPEMAFNYLWGNPSDIGNRTDFSITQSFDFPTSYVYKRQISNLQNEQLQFEYQKQLKTIQLKTKLLCFELIYTNALTLEYTKRKVYAQQISDAYKAKFNIGESNILEFNKAKLNLLTVENELELIEIQRTTLLLQLAGLNGGQSVEFNDTLFETPVIQTNFDEWFETAEKNNPTLSWLKKEVEIGQKQQGLNRAFSLPRFYVGYMSESVVGEHFRGVSFGVSIPLWENKNRIKQAKTKILATESELNDTKLTFYNHLKGVHEKVVKLQNNVNQYRASLQDLDNTRLLKKALDKGEISLINYLLELSFYYESVKRLIELERDFNKAVAELNLYM